MLGRTKYGRKKPKKARKIQTFALFAVVAQNKSINRLHNLGLQ
jgi:hypothetical protein